MLEGSQVGGDNPRGRRFYAGEAAVTSVSIPHSRKQLLADAECLRNVLLFPVSRRDVTGTLLAPLFLP